MYAELMKNFPHYREERCGGLPGHTTACRKLYGGIGDFGGAQVTGTLITDIVTGKQAK